MTDQHTKILFYYEQKQPVHLDCTSGRFYNGDILEINENKKLLILIDRVLGEIPILFEEIENIEKMKEVEE